MLDSRSHISQTDLRLGRLHNPTQIAIQQHSPLVVRVCEARSVKSMDYKQRRLRCKTVEQFQAGRLNPPAAAIFNPESEANSLCSTIIFVLPHH